ncbi:hypothetical protein DNTS_021308, partial [Danionella cerebrum]
MDPEHRQILQKHRVDLVTVINPSEICDGLLSKGIFSQDMIDEIQSKPTRRGQARELVKDLETRGRQAFPAFLECLRENGNSDLAELLQSGDGAYQPIPVPVQPSLIPLPVQIPKCIKEPDRPDLKPTRLVPLRPETLPVKSTFTTSSETVVRPSRQRRDSIQCYKMDSSPCGICLIINNVNFEAISGLKDRKGSNIDSDKMETRFKALNFEVIAKKNLKFKHIKHEMASLAKRDHSMYDCCVVVMLSHGTEASHNRFPGAVHGVDGIAVPVQLITNYLNGQNYAKDIGFEVSPDEVQPSVGGVDDEMDAIPISSSSDSLSTSDELDSRASLPTPSDILVSYSTFP